MIPEGCASCGVHGHSDLCFHSALLLLLLVISQLKGVGSVMQFISTMSLSVPLCTGTCTLDIFPGMMFIKVSLTSKPFSHWTSVSGSNNSGLSLSTGPEFAGTTNNRICMVFRNNYTFPYSFWSTNVTRAWSLNEVEKVIQFCLFLSRKTLINCWHWVFASGLLILQSRIPK